MKSEEEETEWNDPRPDPEEYPDEEF